jgi:hypothetical protein
MPDPRGTNRLDGAVQGARALSSDRLALRCAIRLYRHTQRDGRKSVAVTLWLTLSSETEKLALRQAHAIRHHPYVLMF